MTTADLDEWAASPPACRTGRKRFQRAAVQGPRDGDREASSQRTKAHEREPHRILVGLDPRAVDSTDAETRTRNSSTSPTSTRADACTIPMNFDAWDGEEFDDRRPDCRPRRCGRGPAESRAEEREAEGDDESEAPKRRGSRRR